MLEKRETVNERSDRCQEKKKLFSCSLATRGHHSSLLCMFDLAEFYFHLRLKKKIAMK